MSGSAAAAGAAAGAGRAGVNGLVAFGVVERFVDVGRQRRMAEAFQIIVDGAAEGEFALGAIENGRYRSHHIS